MIMLNSLRRATSMGLAAIVAVALLTSASQAQQAYPSPEDAAAALAAAVKTGTRSTILKVLGRDAEDIIESGDDVADTEMRQRFLSAYDAKHSIKAEGNNEKDRTGEGVGVYAQRIVSSPGKKDGLFWRDDREPSPLGELAAQASTEGYKVTEQAAPYHGYYYRILKGQGPDAPGGPLNYVVKGKIIGGFALIAYPAEYGNSGVMTFMVNHAGTVYQKDLGTRTESIANRIYLFDPDQIWKKVDVVAP